MIVSDENQPHVRVLINVEEEWPRRNLRKSAKGHQIEEVGGFVFRSKRRAAHASPGRAKRLCSPDQGTGVACPAVSTGQPFTSIAINEQQPAAARSASPAAIPEHSDLEHPSFRPDAALLNAAEPVYGASSRAGNMQHSGLAPAISLGNLLPDATAEAGPDDSSNQPDNSLRPAAQLDATEVPGMASDSNARMQRSAEAQPQAADDQRARQDNLLPAPDMASGPVGPKPDAASLQQPFTAEANGTDGTASPGASSQQQHQQTDRATAGETAACRGSMSDLGPLLERMAAICDAVRAQHGADAAAEDAQQADAGGAALTAAPEAVSKMLAGWVTAVRCAHEEGRLEASSAPGLQPADESSDDDEAEEEAELAAAQAAQIHTLQLQRQRLQQELTEWQSLLAGAQESSAGLAVEQAVVAELPAIALEAPTTDVHPSLHVIAAETHRKMTMQVEGLCMMVNKVMALLQVAEDKTAKLFAAHHKVMFRNYPHVDSPLHLIRGFLGLPQSTAS